ncbi:uncharacterized protein ARMOST_16192 [Armillaria ostoyae]|uniref:Uncharacterized protein n=1 Tax=Armillaria ostoyae TaxID=47428 RepID=A0A284RVJ7_ARMOS|nr:uncharacterized protein ARMOST_16192 [Armillaria ostoyae]
MHQLQNTWRGEFQWDTSNHKDYSYYCWHGDWWNRYTEDTICLKALVHIILCEKVEQLSTFKSNIFQDVMMFVSMHMSLFVMAACFGINNGVPQQLRKLLPDVYAELMVFVDHLPLNEHTPSYPFSGFVINIGVAMNSHHDSFDKIIYMAIPFGE